MNGRAPEISLCCLWLTGLPCAGKSTLARSLSVALSELAVRHVVLDADDLRRTLNADLDFSRSARTENARRLAHVAKLFLAHGSLPIVAAISPFRSDRQLAADLLQPFSMREVFLSTPLPVCIERDVKGLYGQALAGGLTAMVGLDVDYEQPEAPAITIPTHRLPLDASVSMVLDALRSAP